MTQIWLEPPRLLWNAIHFPSGDGAGSVSRYVVSARSGRNVVANPGDVHATDKARINIEASRLKIIVVLIEPLRVTGGSALRPRRVSPAHRQYLVGSAAQPVDRR